VGHANKALHTFPTRNDVPYVSHVATNAWPISQIFLLLVSIVVRSVVYTVVAFLYVEHYCRNGIHTERGGESVLLKIC